MFAGPFPRLRSLTTFASNEIPILCSVDILYTDLSWSSSTHGGLSALRESLARAVLADHAILPAAVAALLDAEIETDTKRIDVPRRRDAAHTLRIPTPWNAPLILQRPGRPFTRTEAVHARRLARCCQVAVDAGSR